QPFLGVAWENASNQRMFSRIPIDKSLPRALDLSRIETVVLNSGTWSYGCFTDQQRKYLWRPWSGGNIAGVNLPTLAGLSAGQDAPNKGHTHSTLGANFVDPGLGINKSYALAGDADGNILSGGGIYTYTHETRTDAVFGSMTGVSTLLIARPECFS